MTTDRTRACRGSHRPGRTPRALGAVAGLLGTGLVLGACTGEAADSIGPGTGPEASQTTSPAVSTGGAPRPPVLLLNFDDRAEPDGRLTTVTNSGIAPLRVQLTTYGGGVARSVPSPHGEAARLPAYSATNPGYAIVRVSKVSGRDWLRPRERDFAFGADFWLDPVSDGTTADNGDNLIQRGLYESPSQFKIQVDHRRISCLVRGLGGEVSVQSRPVSPQRWYRTRCVRRGSQLTLTVAEIAKNGTIRPASSSVGIGAIGEVSMPKRTPLSVGGKLAEDGTMYPSSTDQLNGRIDQVYVQYFG